MFDWFKEMGQELGGIDSTAAKKERLEKKEQNKLNFFIFTKSTKTIIIVLAVLYIVIAGSMIIALRNIENTLPQIIKYITMSIIALVVIFSLLFKKKKGEIVALVGVFIFIVGLLISIVLL